MGGIKYCVLLLIVLNGVASLSELNQGYSVDPRSAFDQELYENVLDSNECRRQLEMLEGDNLRWQFLDASGKLPSGIMKGNWNDLGDYHQCLAIHQVINNTEFQGKYCAVTIPIDQEFVQIPDQPDFEWPDFEWPDFEWPDNLPIPNNNTMAAAKLYKALEMYGRAVSGLGEPVENRVFPMIVASQLRMLISVCVPKVCTATEAINFLQSRVPFVNVDFNEYFCRLPNDKPFSAADYTAMAIFSFIGLLLVASTSYDLLSQFYFKIDPSRIKRLYACFSVYTNTRRFLTFNSVPGTLECLDGVRAISMMWVIVGHTFCMTLLAFIHNIGDTVNYMTSFGSIWIISAPITVDTFFLLSGILAVYTTLGKISKPRFIRSIHMFILNRVLRMFPLLAVVVLLQASLFNHLSDGPFWMNVAHAAENCRTYWWAALLYVQNYVNPLEVCVVQTWYLSVDMQLYMTVPLLLLFLFGRRTVAWIAMIAVLLVSLTLSSVISFTNNFSAALGNPARLLQFNDYIQKYYLNTLSRAAPFYVGVIYGYLIVQCKDKKISISKINACALWLMSLGMMAFCIFSIYPVLQLDSDNQLFDNFLNSYMRAIWAAGLGWLIFACVQGYGGPIHWFLSLTMWKLPARMSYAMYLIHVSFMMVANGTWVKTHYFSEGDCIYRYMSDITITFVAAFILCITIDAPCSTLQKMLVNGSRRPQRPQVKPELQKNLASPHEIAAENGHYLKTSL